MTRPSNDSSANTRPCRACGGMGGFNQFRTLQGEGTSTWTMHEWVPCSLCDGTGRELAIAPAPVEGSTQP